MRFLCTALVLCNGLSSPASAEEPFVFQPPPTPPSSTSKEPGEGFSRLRVTIEAHYGYGAFVGYVSDADDALHGQTVGGSLGVTWGQGKRAGRPRIGARLSLSYGQVSGRELSGTELFHVDDRPARDVEEGFLFSARGGLQFSWDSGLWAAGTVGMLLYRRSYGSEARTQSVFPEIIWEGGYNIYFGDVFAFQVSGEVGGSFIRHMRVQLRAAVLLRL